MQAGAELKDWDLWGPLILCLTLAILLSSQSSPANKLNPSLSPADDSSLVFGAVFIVTWCGAAVVTLNAKLLGGSVSFFQSICVLGYCLFPLVLSAIACAVIHAATSGDLPPLPPRSALLCASRSLLAFTPLARRPAGKISFILRACSVVVGCGWCTRASSGFLADVLIPARKALAVYPVCLFYALIAWMVLVRTG